MTGLVGISIKNKHVGELLGSGAFGVVHAFGNDTKWAIKFDILKKEDKSLLHYEKIVYNHLFELQGKFIPELPGYTSRSWASGVVNGHCYLVLERMQAPIESVVTTLLAKPQKSISLAPIAQKMLQCVKAIHDERYLVVDVKAENFMLAYAQKEKKGSGSTADAIARRIRLLDLAMLRLVQSSTGGGMCGTPLYASLNVLKGGIPKKKDDLEALGYVISELVVQVSAGSTAATLPWGKARSDSEIASQKEKQVEHIGSDFYTAMDPVARPIMKEYFEKVRSSAFKKKEDYESVLQILGRLVGLKSKTASGDKEKKGDKESKGRPPRRSKRRRSPSET